MGEKSVQDWISARFKKIRTSSNSSESFGSCPVICGTIYGTSLKEKFQKFAPELFPNSMMQSNWLLMKLEVVVRKGRSWDLVRVRKVRV